MCGGDDGADSGLAIRHGRKGDAHGEDAVLKELPRELVIEGREAGLVREAKDSLDLLDVDFLPVDAVISVAADTTLSIADERDGSQVILNEEGSGT